MVKKKDGWRYFICEKYVKKGWEFERKKRSVGLEKWN